MCFTQILRTSELSSVIRAQAQVSAYVQNRGLHNKMTTDSFLQVLTIYPTWTLQTSETPSSQVPVQVSACIQYLGPDGVHYQSGDRFLSPGAGDMDSADVGNIEQDNPEPSAGEYL